MFKLSNLSVSPERSLSWRKRKFNSAYLFIAPSLLLITVFIIEPILQSGWMSLHDWSIGEAHHKFILLGNYSQLLSDTRFWNALRVTAIYTLFVALGQVGFGLLVASLLIKTSWFTSLLRGAFFFPFIGSLATVGVVWKFLLDPQVGLIDAWLNKLGFHNIEWLQSTSLALPTVILVGIWKNLGFCMIIFIAGMSGISTFLYEAATIDGATSWQQFRYVTIPSLRPAILFTSIIATITGLQLFDLVYVMTNGGPIFGTESVVMYLYQRGFVDFRMGYASAIAWILFIVVLLLSIFQLKLFRFRDVD